MKDLRMWGMEIAKFIPLTKPDREMSSNDLIPYQVLR